MINSNGETEIDGDGSEDEADQILEVRRSVLRQTFFELLLYCPHFDSVVRCCDLSSSHEHLNDNSRVLLRPKR